MVTPGTMTNRIDAAVTDHVATRHRLTAGLTQSGFDRLNRLLAKFLATVEQPLSSRDSGSRTGERYQVMDPP